MDPFKKTARIIGILFLVAMIGSLTGGGILESILSKPINTTLISENESLIKTGVLLEMINAFAVLGIGILLFPVLKLKSVKIAIGYLCFRILEMVSCLAAAFIPLSILKSNAGFGESILTARSDIASILIPLFFCLGALLLYFFLYRTKFLPRFISIWGFIGVSGIIVLNLTTIQSNAGMALALPIILNEIFMGIWLIVKGFINVKTQQWKL
ncbi:DUF4386 domain-containing protein [Sunxiuqinia sp. A32]|uniref:DUF4386 domain-containing protein n=1 Tax=Sunxiuqinia sp. A32 TaxID=3461496 RepID=UPI00404532E9